MGFYFERKIKMNKKYYISTAIAYTSGKPHIGNTYEIVLADAIARFKRLEGYDVYFQTGTDEHGEKIENKAHDAHIEPQEYVDNIAGIVKNIWDTMNTSYDAFVRTTNPEHERVVQDIFKKGSMKVGIVHHVNLSGLNQNLLIISALTVEEKFIKLKKKLTL